jgi:sec-independent protein translocase protein TatC
MAFGYFVVAPLSIQFFGTYTMSSQIENIFTINSYMSTVISTVFYTGLFFLLPVVSYLLTKIGLFDAAFLITYRKHAIVAILILAAIITPPDVLSQVIVSIPILILYEVGIYVAKRVEKNQRNENKS